MLNRLNHNHLYYFWIIANEGNLKKASEKLNLAVSTISDHLRALEQELNSPLFDRVSKRLKLNENGLHLLEICTEHFSRLGPALDLIINHEQKLQRIPLRIGIAPTISKEVIYRVIARLMEDPRYLIKVYENDSARLQREYTEKNLDLLIADFHFSTPFKTAVIPILVKEYWAVCSQNSAHNFASRPFPQSLDGAKFVNYTEKSKLHFQILDYFKAAKISPQRLGEIDDFTLMLESALRGQSFAILPMDAIENYLDQGMLVKIGKILNVNNQLNAIINESSLGSEFVDEFEGMVKDKTTR